MFGRLESQSKMLQERCHIVQLLQAVCLRFVLPYLIRPWALFQLILVDLVFRENLHQNRSRIAIDVPLLELFPIHFFSHVVSARSPACVRLHRMFRPCDPPWYLSSSQRLRKKQRRHLRGSPQHSHLTPRSSVQLYRPSPPVFSSKALHLYSFYRSSLWTEMFRARYMKRGRRDVL